MMRGSLSQFADDTKLERTSDMEKVFAAIEMDMDGLENWAVRNIMKFDKGMGEGLHLRRNIPIHRFMVVASYLESPLSEKDIRVLIDPVFNMGQHCVLEAKKADSILGCIRHIIAGRTRQGPSFSLSTGEGPEQLEHWVLFYISILV